MKRVRWAFLVLAGLVAVGISASAVLAGSSKTTATYVSDAITASAHANDGVPLVYGGTATFTFNVADLGSAVTGSVFLNFRGDSRSFGLNGGSGFPATVKVAVTGVGTGTYTTTLTNPWRPHVYGTIADFGHDVYGTLNLPTYVWRGAATLTVSVTSVTTKTYLTLQSDGVVIGYTEIG